MVMITLTVSETHLVLHVFEALLVPTQQTHSDKLL